MDAQEASELIERMHAEETVRNDSIIAWYRFYERHLPTMHPERSDVDLMRTVALWMELTDKGGSPGFPYEYRSEFQFPAVNPNIEPRTNIGWFLGIAVIGCGIVAIFFNWKISLALVALGTIVQYVGYRLNGGPANADLMKEGTKLYEREGRRVIEWSEQHRAD